MKDDTMNSAFQDNTSCTNTPYDNTSCGNTSCDNRDKNEVEKTLSNKFLSSESLSPDKGIIKNFHNRTKETPILLGLHGYGDSASGFMQFLNELEPHIPAVALNAPYSMADIFPSSSPAPEGFSWLSNMLQEGEILNKEADEACEYIVEWCNRNIGDNDFGYSLIPIGFSQGAFLVTELLRMIPERIVAAVILSGLRVPAIFPTDQKGDEKLIALKDEGEGIPTFYGYGTCDSIIDFGDSQVTEDWLAVVSDVQIHRYNGMDHVISTAEVEDIRGFLGDFINRNNFIGRNERGKGIEI